MKFFTWRTAAAAAGVVCSQLLMIRVLELPYWGVILATLVLGLWMGKQAFLGDLEAELRRLRRTYEDCREAFEVCAPEDVSEVAAVRFESSMQALKRHIDFYAEMLDEARAAPMWTPWVALWKRWRGKP